MSMRFGVAFWSMDPVEELVRLAECADELNFDSYWLAEYYHYRSAGPIFALIGKATKNIKLGLGILPTHTRHPGLTAMEAATLDEICDGRLIMGLGAAKTAAQRHGEGASPLASMRETLPLVRSLLDGESVDHDGKLWQVRNTRLAFPSRKGMPIYVGTYPYSPKMLHLSGQMADGVALVWCTPDWVRRARETVAEGAASVGRDPSAVDMAAYLVISVDPDAAKARDACRRLIGSYAPRNHRWFEGGLATPEDLEPVVAAWNRGGLDAAEQAVSDALVDKVAIAGEPAYVKDRLAEYSAAGLDLAIAYQVVGPDKYESMRLIAAEVL